MAEVIKVLNVTDLSSYLRVHRATIYRLLKNRELPAFKVGSDWRFNIEMIDEWRVQKTVARTEELAASAEISRPRGYRGRKIGKLGF